MWQKVDNKLYQKFTFGDFKGALVFINQVAGIANELNHHPTIHNTYSTVELWLSTHDVDDTVTSQDRQFAKRIDELVGAQQQATVSVLLPQKNTELKVFTDGGSRGNPGPSAGSFVILNVDDTVVKKSGLYLGITTNNQAEYQALKMGLEEAQRLGARIVHIHMDSLLVVNQMKGIFKVKNRDLWPIHDAIKTFLKNFHQVTFSHVPRELNKLADAEVNEILDTVAKQY